MNIEMIGKMIRERRLALQVSQEQLSELSGVAIKTIYAIEQGKANPSWVTLMKVLDTLGLEIQVGIKQMDS